MSYKRFVFGTDPHGEHVNREAWDAMLAFCADFKPHRRILGGDVFDFASFRGGASDAEKEESLENDLAAGIRLCVEFRPSDWLLGNHDIRPWKIAKSGKTAALRDYAKGVCEVIEKEQRKQGCRIYGYRVNEFCRIGPTLKAIHGFAHGKYSAAAQALAFGNVIAGHTHRIDYHRTASVDVRECWTVGCLRNPFAEFNERTISTLAHAHGFAFGYYDEHGPGFSVYQARKQEDGKWVINGKTY